MIPTGDRHRRFWAWLGAITPGAKPPAFVGNWPRGGAKSTSAELGVVWCGLTLRRRFALYVCGTQDQAEQHLDTIAALLEDAGEQRAVNTYGNSQGWTSKLLRTTRGFNALAVGLDSNVRGAKLDEVRPDLIILDDVDDRHDSPKTTAKKLKTLLQSIIPAGSADAAVLFIQNTIHANSCMAQILDGRADALLARVVSSEPAVIGLRVARAQTDDGPRYRVVEGAPTWPEGQSLAVCEGQINEWGKDAFLGESQHEVGRSGVAFPAFRPDVGGPHVVAPFPIPADWRVWGGFDHGFDHPTAAYLLAEHNGEVLVIAEHIARRKLAPYHAEALRALCASVGRQIEDVTWYAGHDVFLTGRSVATTETIADTYEKLGVRLVRAKLDRVNRAHAVRERLGAVDDDGALESEPSLRIFATCPRLIACLPALLVDPDRPDDVQKTDADANGNGGDDPYDAMTYGLMESGRGFLAGWV